MKHNFLLALIVALLAMIVFSMPCNAQPRNLQARVIEVIKQDKRRIECKAVSMANDTITIRYGFSGWVGNKGQIKAGTWLTIHSDYSDKYKEWYCKKIFINR